MSLGLLIFEDSPAGATAARLRFGGLRNVERGIRTLARAGVERLLIVLPEGQTLPSLGKVTRQLNIAVDTVTWGERAEFPIETGDRVLLCLGEYVHHHSSLSAFLTDTPHATAVVAQTSAAPSQNQPFLSFDPSASRFVPSAASGDVISGAFLADGSLPWLDMIQQRQAPLDMLAQQPIATQAGDERLWRRVSDRRSARQARAMLFGQVTKKTSGPVSRHINARLSIPISKVLIETGISPHMVTVLFVLTSGLSTAWLVSDPREYWRLALAGFLWQMAAVLDRCDGEIARVKLCESKFGAWFDTVTDNIAYLATYVAFLIGVTRLHPDKPWALYLGYSAIVALIVALGIMYNYAIKTGSGSLQNYLVGFRNHVSADEKNSIYRILERYAFIAKRDFFSFVHFLCCLFGSFETLYGYTVGGLHLIVLGVLLSQRKMLEGHRRQEAQEEVASDVVPVGIGEARQ